MSTTEPNAQPAPEQQPDVQQNPDTEPAANQPSEPTEAVAPEAQDPTQTNTPPVVPGAEPADTLAPIEPQPAADRTGVASVNQPLGETVGQSTQAEGSATTFTCPACGQSLNVRIA